MADAGHGLSLGLCACSHVRHHQLASPVHLLHPRRTQRRSDRAGRNLLSGRDRFHSTDLWYTDRQPSGTRRRDGILHGSRRGHVPRLHHRERAQRREGSRQNPVVADSSNGIGCVPRSGTHGIQGLGRSLLRTRKPRPADRSRQSRGVFDRPQCLARTRAEGWQGLSPSASRPRSLQIDQRYAGAQRR